MVDAITETTLPKASPDEKTSPPKPQDKWLSSWLRAIAYFPQSFTAIERVLGESVITSVLENPSAWELYQNSQIEHQQLAEIEGRANAIHTHYGVGKVPTEQFEILWNEAKKEVEKVIFNQLTLLGVNNVRESGLQSFFNDPRNRTTLEEVRKLFIAQSAAIFSPKGKQLAAEHKSKALTRARGGDEGTLPDMLMQGVIYEATNQEMTNIRAQRMKNALAESVA